MRTRSSLKLPRRSGIRPVMRKSWVPFAAATFGVFFLEALAVRRRRNLNRARDTRDVRPRHRVSFLSTPIACRVDAGFATYWKQLGRTTNYDRAIEIAARHEEIHLDDAFPPFATDGTALWSGFAQTSPRPLLVKLHGSTDWYVDGRTGKPAKLRHPMPLFGRATLRLSEGRELSSALVLPSREKLLTRAPYPRLSQRFYNAADACDLAVCVGSSLRDEHVREAIRSTAHNVPTFVVNPQGENCGIEEAFAIGQHASTFLISTLPNALLTDNPAAVLHGASRETQRASPGLLEAARNLLDTRAATVQRCQSADEFEKLAAALHPAFLAKLLDDDSPTVARYALGLLAASPMVVQLMERADRSRHIGDEDFRTDLNLLRKMIQSQSSTAVALASAP